MKTKGRIVALALAALMLFSVLAGLMGVIGYAANANEYDITLIRRTSGNTGAVSSLSNTNYNINFIYYVNLSNFNLPSTFDGDFSNIDFKIGGGFQKNGGDSGSRLSISASTTGNLLKLDVKLSNVYYKSRNNSYDLEITLQSALASGQGTSNIITSDVVLNLDVYDYLESQKGGGGGGGSTDDDNYESEIVIENVYITDADGVRIDKVDKDTPAFNIVVVYLDRGLEEVDTDQFTNRTLEVYLTQPGGFVPGNGNTGTLRYVSDSSNGYPRFRAEFRNITYNGGSDTITFLTSYDIYGTIVTGGENATITSVSNEEKDKLDPLTPHIIVNEYSYGQGQIAAGQEFTLSLSIKNTSADIPLENIIMTVTPQTIAETTSGSTNGGLTITSSSNTFYMETLGVGESQSHTINLRAEPNAAVGSHKVEITFKFQYVDDVNNARKDSTDEESIAIPVTQIDRFSVDPLTEFPEWMTAGDRGYMTLTFVNRGKSTTYNISGTLQGDVSNAGQSQHYGNLEAGKSGYLDFEIYCYEPGEVNGEILLEYEDENANQNQVVIPFTINVDAPYYPPQDDYDPQDDYVEPEEETNTATLVLCGLGGLLIAIPIVLYMHKRVKAKGIEELDEDF